MDFASWPDAAFKKSENDAAEKGAKTFALVAIVKNEARYLLEWLAFYDCIGVRNFFIFDNESTDETREILEAYAKFVNIEIIHWPSRKGISPQITAYNYFIENYRDKFEFAAFFDLDEFLIPHENIEFADFLDRIPDYVGAIGFNQRVFGSSSELTYKSDLVMRRFKQCSETQYDENRYYKSLYRLRNIRNITNVHGSPLTFGAYSFADFLPLFQHETRPGTASRIRFPGFQLNHYILKSLEEFRGKQRRGSVDEPDLEVQSSRYADGYFTGREPHINLSTCNLAGIWIPKVIEKLLSFRERSIRDGRRDYVFQFYRSLFEASPQRPSHIHLGATKFRQARADIHDGLTGLRRQAAGGMSFRSQAIARTREPRVACIMMQRDEEALMTSWIRYHATLFGMSNLFIFDNGSVSQGVIDDLTKFEDLGANIIWDYKSPDHYDQKGKLAGELITSLAPCYDIFLPLDCDEFFVLKTGPSSITCDRQAILEALGPLLAAQDVLQVTQAFFNVLGHTGWFWCWPHRKSFFARGFSYLDHGFHNGRTETGNARSTSFAYMHFHHKPHAMMVQHAKNKLAPYTNVEDRDALATYRGTAYHCVQPILQNYCEYMSRFETDNASFLPAFPDFLKKIGAPVPFE